VTYLVLPACPAGAALPAAVGPTFGARSQAPSPCAGTQEDLTRQRCVSAELAPPWPERMGLAGAACPENSGKNLTRKAAPTRKARATKPVMMQMVARPEQESFQTHHMTNNRIENTKAQPTFSRKTELQCDAKKKKMSPRKKDHAVFRIIFLWFGFSWAGGPLFSCTFDAVLCPTHPLHLEIADGPSKC